MTATITTVGIFLTEDERRHLIRLCNELEVMEESAQRRHEGPEAQTRAAERAALRKLMGLPAANAFSTATTDREQLVAEVVATAKRWWSSVRAKANHARMPTVELKLWQAIRAVMQLDGEDVR